MSTQTPTPTISSLTTHLDTLLTQYLTLLTTHQSLSTSSNSSFRTGLFSLTEANFRSPNRTRYGPDLYSDKMQATLLLEHSGPPNTETPRLQFRRLATGVPTRRRRQNFSGEETKTGPDEVKMGGSLEKVAAEPEHAAASKAEATPHSPSETSSKSTSQLPTPPVSRDSTPASTESPDRTAAPTFPKTSSHEDTAESSTATQPSDPEPTPDLPPDPIRQFGILVPGSLRAAQTSFSRAAEGWIESIERDGQMRELEIEIRRVRKRLRKAEAEAEAEEADGTKGGVKEPEEVENEDGLDGES